MGGLGFPHGVHVDLCREVLLSRLLGRLSQALAQCL